MLDEGLDISVAPFLTVNLAPSEGKVNVFASVKHRGQLFFLETAVKPGADGPRAAVFSNRYQTRSGRDVRGAVRPHLEDLMDKLHEAAIAAVVEHPNLLAA